jgi:hypothetical protein
LIDAATTDAEITQVNNALNLFAGNQRVIYVTGKGYPPARAIRGGPLRSYKR